MASSRAGNAGYAFICSPFSFPCLSVCAAAGAAFYRAGGRRFGTALAGHLHLVFSAASRSNGIKMNGMTRCKISKDIAGKAVIYLIDEMMFV